MAYTSLDAKRVVVACDKASEHLEKAFKGVGNALVRAYVAPQHARERQRTIERIKHLAQAAQTQTGHVLINSDDFVAIADAYLKEYGSST